MLESLFNKVAGLKVAGLQAFIKKKLQHRCVSVNIAKFFRKGFLLHDGFSIGKFQDSGKCYQQLELEYLNQRRWWDVYVCFIVLLNVQYVMLNTFNKNPTPTFNIFSCWTEFLKMLLLLALLMDWINMILTSEVQALKEYFLMLHWLLLGLLQ